MCTKAKNAALRGGVLVLAVHDHSRLSVCSAPLPLGILSLAQPHSLLCWVHAWPPKHQGQKQRAQHLDSLRRVHCESQESPEWAG